MRALLSTLPVLALAGGCGESPPSTVEREAALTYPQATILGFEDAAAWTAPGMTLTLSDLRTQGSWSLGLPARGYTVLRSAPMSSVAASTARMAVDIRLPSPQMNPWWYGSLEARISIPSQGLNDVLVGQQSLNGRPLDTFTTVEMAIPSAIFSKLGATYTDLTVAIILNVPTNATGLYRLDKLRFGPDTVGTPPTVTITKPYYDNSRYFAGHQLAFAGTASDPEDVTVPATRCRWEILSGTTPVYTGQGTSGTYPLPSSVTAPTTYTIRFTATDSQQMSTTVSRTMIVYPWEGAVQTGLTWSGPAWQGNGTAENTVFYFTVAPSDVGQFFRFQVLAPAVAFDGFIVRGDRQGDVVDYRDYDSGDNPNRAAWITDPYVGPQLEFQAWAPGEHTLALRALTYAPADWAQKMVTPSGTIAQYRFTKSPSSQAAAAGTAVFVVRDYAAGEFWLDDESQQGATFDFAPLQAGFNQVHQAYASFMGARYTKYGSASSVGFPQWPTYGGGADASNPIRIGRPTWTARTMGPFAFEHELAHHFSAAYPFTYSLKAPPCTDVECTNSERIVDYFIGHLLAPDGAGAMSQRAYVRWEQEMMDYDNMKTPPSWHEAIANRGSALLLRRVVGGWGPIRDALRSYVPGYAGSQCNTDPYTRLRDLYTKLVNAIPDPAKRQAFLGQYRKWGVPFVDPSFTFTDADNDGIVAGIDPNDYDSGVTLVDEECRDERRCVQNGRDENLDGVVDSGILLASESPVIGEHTPAGRERSTRRKLYIAQGKTVTVDAVAAKTIGLAVYRCNVPFGTKGSFQSPDVAAHCPRSSTPPYQAVPLASDRRATPSITFVAPATGIYTFDFNETVWSLSDPGNPIYYSVTIR